MKMTQRKKSKSEAQSGQKNGTKPANRTIEAPTESKDLMVFDYLHRLYPQLEQGRQVSSTHGTRNSHMARLQLRL